MKRWRLGDEVPVPRTWFLWLSPLCLRRVERLGCVMNLIRGFDEIHERVGKGPGLIPTFDDVLPWIQV